MKGVLGSLFAFFVHLGGFGLLAMGILDSSFLFMPLGNDLLIVAMTARNHQKVLYYAAMATAGSVLGCLLLDVISRKGGEEGLSKRVSKKRLDYVKRKVSKRAGWAIAIAALMPPPFPFTPFVAGAAALQYPRKKLLSVIAGARFVRFVGDGVLAVIFGRRILHLAETPAVRYTIVALIVVSIGGSAWSIYTWVRKSKEKAVAAGHGTKPEVAES